VAADELPAEKLGWQPTCDFILNEGSQSFERTLPVPLGPIMADIMLVNPAFETSYWGLEHALPLFGKRANVPPVSGNAAHGLAARPRGDAS
jgi:hypothetical protein